MKAFQFQKEGIIRDWNTGSPILNYTGLCVVYGENMGITGTAFLTGIENGQRFWKAI